MPKKKSLQASLAHQQSRLQKQAHLLQSAKASEKKQKAATKKNSLRPTIPFKPTDRIFLIGEGNFSFAYSLVVYSPLPDLQHLPPGNITASAYDTEAECVEKYPDAEEKIQILRAKGVQVLFGIDATKLEKYSVLKGMRFDKVVWNFPHAGRGIADQDRNILSNQLMILGFLRSVSDFLATGPVPLSHSSKRKRRPDDDDDDEKDCSDVGDDSDVESCRGSVIITLRNVFPYTTWDIPKLAKRPPPPSSTSSKHQYANYVLLRSFVFHRWAWKGYNHRMTKGERGKTGGGGEDRSWEFYLRDLG